MQIVFRSVMIGAITLLNACSDGSEIGEASSSQPSERPSAPTSKNIRIKSIDDAIKRIPKISGCKWRIFVEDEDRNAGFRFCNTASDLPNTLTVSDVSKRDFFSSLVAAYPYDRSYEGYPFYDIGGVYNGFVLRLNSISERDKSEYLAETGLTADQLDALLEGKTNEVRLDFLRFQTDSAYLWSLDLFEFSTIQERYLLAREITPRSRTGGRLTEFGRQQEVKLREEEKENRQQEAAAVANEKEKSRERDALLNNAPNRKILLLRGGASNADFGPLQFPWVYPQSYSKFKEAAAFIAAADRTAEYPMGYYNFLLEHKYNVAGVLPSSTIAGYILDSEDQRVWRSYLGVISLGRQDLINRVFEYHSGTVFEKNSKRDDLLNEISTLIDQDITEFKESSFYLPIEGHMTARYDFDQNAFVQIPKETYFKVRSALGRQYLHGDENLVTDWLSDNVLTTLNHSLGTFKIEVPPEEAQAYVDRYAETTFDDNEFKFVFHVVFGEGDFTLGRGNTLEVTNLEQKFRGFENSDFPHFTWNAECITIVKGKEFWGSRDWPTDKHATYSHGPTANDELCIFLTRAMDAYSNTKKQ